MIGSGERQLGITQWWASGSAKRHMLEKHDVAIDEINEVMETRPQPRRGKRRRGEQRYYVVGRTSAGRELLIVFRLVAGVAEIITAWDV